MEVLSSKIVFEAPILRVEERKVKIRKGREETRWVVVRQPGVRIVALTKNKNIVLIKERKEVSSEYSISLPGGKVPNTDTNPEEIKRVASVELANETGYEAKNIEMLCKQKHESNWLEREFYVFVAWDLVYTGPKHEKNEDIIPFNISVKDIEEMTLRDGYPIHVVDALKRGVSFFREKELLTAPI